MVRLKSYLFEKIGFLEKIYAYNRVRRNNWVKQNAKSIVSGSRILDIGAGSCPYRPLFAHCEYISHDFKQLEETQIQDQAGYGKIDIVCDILEIPFPDKSFDVILCTEVIEHVPEPIKVIKEISRLLKDDGILLITAPLQSGLHQEPFHFYGGYTKYWYSNFLTQNKFDRIKIVPNGSLSLTFMSLGLTFFKYLLEILTQKNNILQKTSALIFIILMLVPLLILNPIICFVVDYLFFEDKFTAGYHVSARKSKNKYIK